MSLFPILASVLRFLFLPRLDSYDPGSLKVRSRQRAGLDRYFVHRLDEYLTMWTYDRGTANEGRPVLPHHTPNLDEVVIETKTVYDWGLELQSYKFTESNRDPIKEHNITKLLIEAGLIWKGSPPWWRTLEHN